MTDAERALLEAALDMPHDKLDELRFAVLRERAPAGMRGAYIRAKANIFIARAGMEALHASELVRASGNADWYPAG